MTISASASQNSFQETIISRSSRWSTTAQLLALIALAPSCALAAGDESDRAGSAGDAALSQRVPFGQQAPPRDHSTSHPMSVQSAEQGADSASSQPPSDEAPLPLAPPSDKRTAKNKKEGTKSSPLGTLTTILGSLGVVLAVFFVVVWISRKAAPPSHATLPAEVVQSLGRAPLLGRQQAQLLRVGKKLVLISATTNGVEPITEITDPLEVDRLCGLCEQNRPGSISETFRHVLSQYTSEPVSESYAGRPRARTSRADPTGSRSR